MSGSPSMTGRAVAETPARAARVRAPRLRAAGVLAGWDVGADLARGEVGSAREGGVPLVPVPTPCLPGERFRRATRECLLAVAAAHAALADGGLDAGSLAGERTGILYVTATGYAAANRAFLEDEGSTTLHFPYTSPSAVPGEVSIEFGIRGPYVNLMGGAPAALAGLWYAADWLASGAADRVLVIGVETVHDVRDLFTRARRLFQGPLLENAVCLLLEPGADSALAWISARTGRGDLAIAIDHVLGGALEGDQPGTVLTGAMPGRAVARAEAGALRARGVPPSAVGPAAPGEALASGPLLALARARRADRPRPWLFTATWRDEYAALRWS